MMDAMKKALMTDIWDRIESALGRMSVEEIQESFRKSIEQQIAEAKTYREKVYERPIGFFVMPHLSERTSAFDWHDDRGELITATSMQAAAEQYFEMTGVMVMDVAVDADLWASQGHTSGYLFDLTPADGNGTSADHERKRDTEG